MHPRLAAVALYSTASSTTPSFLLSPSPATKLVVTRCSIRVVLLSSLYTLISSPSRALASLPTSPMRKLRKSASCCCRPCVCASPCFRSSQSCSRFLGFSLLLLPFASWYETKLCVLKLFFFLLQALTKANNIVFGFIPRPSQSCFGQGLELTTTSSDEGKRERERER